MVQNKKYVNRYIDSLIVEIMKIDTSVDINTIYIGGGSPNSISDEHMDKLLKYISKKISISRLKEYTIEATPTELNKKRVQILKKYGINRVSMPIQTVSNFQKKTTGLVYSEKEVHAAICNLKNVGIENINIDLLFPLIEENFNLQEFIKKIKLYNITHVTCYPLETFLESSKYSQNELYKEIIEELEDNGYIQYDLLHFSKKGFENIHNSNYWRRKEYYGIGAGAHSFIEGYRYSNYTDIQEYIDKSELGLSTVEEVNRLSNKEAIEEEFFLGLQLLEGVDMEYIGKIYEEDLFNKFLPQIEKHIFFGNLKLEENILKLTTQGLLKSDEVLADFLIE